MNLEETHKIEVLVREGLMQDIQGIFFHVLTPGPSKKSKQNCRLNARHKIKSKKKSSENHEGDKERKSSLYLESILIKKHASPPMAFSSTSRHLQVLLHAPATTPPGPALGSAAGATAPGLQKLGVSKNCYAKRLVKSQITLYL